MHVHNCVHNWLAIFHKTEQSAHDPVTSAQFASFTNRILLYNVINHSHDSAMCTKLCRPKTKQDCNAILGMSDITMLGLSTLAIMYTFAVTTTLVTTSADAECSFSRYNQLLIPQCMHLAQ